MIKKLVYTFILLFHSILNFSQDIISENQIVYKKYVYKNGIIASEGFLKNDKPDGFWKSSYVSGIKKSEGKWVNNKLDSIWIFYNELGDTSEKINYFDGKKNGYNYKYFSDNENRNRIKSKELYLNGLRNGISYFYYPDGKIKTEIPFTDDKKNGIAYEYNINGIISSIYRYRNNDVIFYENINRFNLSGQKDGVWKIFDKEGKLIEEKTYVNGKLNGYVKTYDKNGFLINTLRYKNDEIVQDSTFDENSVEIKEEYDSDGSLVFQGGYLFDTPVGTHRTFNKKGEVIQSKTYDLKGTLIANGIINTDGSKNGKWVEYYENGKVKSTGQYKNDKKDGKWIYYHKKGTIQQTGNYSNGKLTGLWSWYFENGGLLLEEYFLLGLSDGESIEFEESGDTIAKGLYIQGNKEGKWFFKVGDMISTGNYSNDQKDGLWQQFFTNGNLFFKGHYVQGNPDGKHEYYYPSGKIYEERYYSDGLKVKSWVKYKESGDHFIVVQYRNNTEFKVNGIKIRNTFEEER